MDVRDVNNYMAAALKTQFKKNNIPQYVEEPSNYNGVDVDNLYRSKRHYNRYKKLNKTQANRKLSRYLTKYVTKNDTSFTRLVWHSSRSISALFTSIRLPDIDSELLQKELDKNCDKIRVVENEWYTLYILDFQLSEEIFADMFLVNSEIFQYFLDKQA